MITLTTAALLGMIGDMLPFVDPDKDSTAHHCVRIEQRGDTLRMLATNRAQAFRVEWVADAVAGILSDTFDVRITPTDAKAIVSSFKLGMKLEHAPVALTVAGQVGRQRLMIIREGEPELWSALTMHVAARGVPDLEAGDSPEIDIHNVIDAGRERVGRGQMLAVSWDSRLLANLGKVDRHGALTMAFTSTRDGLPVYVAAEKRFDGIMYPVKRRTEEYRPGAASDILRTGSGVLAVGDDGLVLSTDPA